MAAAGLLTSLDGDIHLRRPGREESDKKGAKRPGCNVRTGRYQEFFFFKVNLRTRGGQTRCHEFNVPVCLLHSCIVGSIGSSTLLDASVTAVGQLLSNSYPQTVLSGRF